MKCCAPILDERCLKLRASRSTSLRCQRDGKYPLAGAFGTRWFCFEHARIWREHNRIVERIRSL